MPDLIAIESSQLLSSIKELELELNEKVKAVGVLHPNVTQLRNQIRESYKTLIVKEFNVSQDCDAESLIWKETYRVIEEYRKRLLRAFPPPKTEQPSEEYIPLVKDFATFLNNSSQFYLSLIQALDQKYSLPVLEQVNQRHEPLFGLNLEINSTTFKDIDIRRLIKTYQKTLIFLGDLARYLELHKADKTPRKWDTARLYYKSAINIIYNNGNPYNQLAVISTYERDELSAIYFYYRSLVVTCPFPNAKSNLDAIMSKLLKSGSQLQDLPTNTPNQTLFFKYFLYSHAVLFKRQELDAFLTFKPTVMSTFKTLIRNRELTPEQNLMITSINLAAYEFLMYNVQEASENNLYQRNAAIFSIDMFKTYMENGIDALDKLSFHRRRQEFVYESLPGGLKRTLPAIYIYAQWTKVNIDYIRSALSSSGTLEELGGELCHDSFWQKFKGFAQALRRVKKKIKHQPSPVVLEEEIELSGQLFARVPFSIPSRFLLAGISEASRETKAGWRVRKLLATTTAVSRLTSGNTRKPPLAQAEEAAATIVEEATPVDEGSSGSKNDDEDSVCSETNNGDFRGVADESSDEEVFVFQGRQQRGASSSPPVEAVIETSPPAAPLMASSPREKPQDLFQPLGDSSFQPLFFNNEPRPSPFARTVEEEYVDNLVNDNEVASSFADMRLNSSFSDPFYRPPGASFYSQQAPPNYNANSFLTRFDSDIWAPLGAQSFTRNSISDGVSSFAGEIDKGRRVSESSFFGGPFPYPPSTQPQPPAHFRHSIALGPRPPPGFGPPPQPMTKPSHPNLFPHGQGPKPVGSVGGDDGSGGYPHMFPSGPYHGFLGR